MLKFKRVFVLIFSSLLLFSCTKTNEKSISTRVDKKFPVVTLSRGNAGDMIKKIIASDGAADDWFGASIAIEEHYVVVGVNHDDNNRGSIYVYDLTKGESEEGYERKIIVSDGLEDDRFGFSVTIEGNYVVVGANRDDDTGRNLSSIYLFVNAPYYKLDIEDQNGIETIEVKKNGNEIPLPIYSMIFNEGNYNIKVINKIGNETIYNFEVRFEK